MSPEELDAIERRAEVARSYEKTRREVNMSPEEMAAKMIDAWDQLDRVRRERDDWRQRAELLEFELKNERCSSETNREENRALRADVEKCSAEIYMLETKLARTCALLAEARAGVKS